jgi:hypothetical protein
MSREHCEASHRLMGRHWTDFRPVLENPAAAWRRIELCWPRATGRTPARALMIRVENLIYSPRELACMRSTLRNRIYLFRPRRRINRETASGMRADAARFRKTERIVIGDEDGFPEHARGNALAIHDCASQLPGAR